MIPVLGSSLRAADLKDPFIRINLFGGIGLVSGDIMTLEKESCKRNRV
jgi:hypothetical protein